MKNPDEYRKFLNQKQTELRSLLTKSENHISAIDAALKQHARLHSANMTFSETGSYADALLAGLTELRWRSISKNDGHSIAWMIWHIARIEDVTMNILVGDAQQVLHRKDWATRLNVTDQDTGNSMTKDDIARISSEIDLAALRAYRAAVGKGTREIIKELSSSELKRKVEPTRLHKILDQKAVSEESKGLLDYWGNRDTAGLLLMPATRHNLVHLNEAARIKF